jgi:hypothetical protein
MPVLFPLLEIVVDPLFAGDIQVGDKPPILAMTLARGVEEVKAVAIVYVAVYRVPVVMDCCAKSAPTAELEVGVLAIVDAIVDMFGEVQLVNTTAGLVIESWGALVVVVAAAAV